MATSIIQSSLSAGEISRNLWGRVDLDKYHVGAALMRNFFVDYRGGASTRPGTEFIAAVRYGGLLSGLPAKARLLPFIVASYQSYVLEFGDRYVRFFSDGAPVVEAGENIIGITTSDPCTITLIAHGYTLGQEVILTGLTGDFSKLNNQTFVVVPIDADHFAIQDIFQDGVDASGFAPWDHTGGAQASRVYELETPYTSDELPLLKYDQSADVMTLTHPAHPPQELRRLTASTFSIVPVVIGPVLDPPAGAVATPSTAGALQFGYVVCAADDAGNLSLPSAAATCNSIVLNQTTGDAISITWGAVTNATRYRIFKWGPIGAGQPAPTNFGFIGETTALAFSDANFAPDYATNPPQFRNPLAAGNPTCSTYFQQRHCYGGITPEQLDMSQTGLFNNFDVSNAVLDSDAISISISSRQVNTIRSMLPMASGLVVLTSGGAFQVSGGSPQAAVTPSTVSVLPQASSGANDLPPIVVNYDILYVQNKGSIVRDLAYNFYIQTYYGFDRSALANHLFFGHTLQEWCYQEEPFKVIWAVREDGVLLSLTYVPEQEVYGWAHHDTSGFIESVCSVPEGNEDSVYLIVRRNLGGRQLRCIERFSSRKVNQVEDSWSLDCALQLDQSRPDGDLNFTYYGEGLVQVKATTMPFAPTDNGKVIWLDDGGKLTIQSVSDASTLICEVNKPLWNQVPDLSTVEYFTVLSGTWTMIAPTTEVSHLFHLKGKQVTIIADGQDIQGTVSASGTVTLPYPATKVLVGQGFTAQLQSLDIDVGDPTVQGKRKRIPAVTVRVDNTRGLKVGQDFDDLVPIEELPASDYTPPLPLVSADQRIVIAGGWNTGGRVSVQQDAPFPATVLGLIPEVQFGDNQS